MLTLQEFDYIIHDNIVYDLQLLNYIDSEGKDHVVKDLGTLHSLVASQNCSIKLEGLDYYNKELYDCCLSFNHTGPVTCHAFRAFKNSKSFPAHEDPYDVVLRVMYGTKHIIMNEQEIVLKEGDQLFIPKNTMHEAINKEESLILSFGLEKFLIDKM